MNFEKELKELEDDVLKNIVLLKKELEDYKLVYNILVKYRKKGDE